MPSFPLRVAPAARTVLLGVAVAAVLPASSLAASQQAPGTTTAPAPAPTTTPAPAPAPAPTDPRKAVVAQGVKFGDIDLSGQTKNQAKSILRRALKAQRPSTESVVVTIAGRRHRLKMSTINYRFDLEKLAASAATAPANTTLPTATAWTTHALARWFRSISSMTKATRNATISIGITKQRVSHSRSGWKVDRSTLEKAVLPVLKDPTKARALTVGVVRTKPAVTATSLARQYSTIVTVDRQTFRLRLFKRLKLSKSYKIAVGAAGHGTPAGTYSVTSKQVNPTWHVPNSAWAGDLAGKTIPGGAPNNPLKARWLGLRDGIGIHGTAETWSLGSRASHGCIRMHPSDVIDLYPRVPMGTTVKVR